MNITRDGEKIARRGICCPISFVGAEPKLATAFPKSYRGLDPLEMIRGKDNRFLLGVTGGIASGKSTVVNMFKEKGALVIDFDLLARRVVEPDKPAWKNIVSCFGRQVLRKDRTLDRKKLADIAFKDMKKRKKIEAFTHPEIYGEFIRELAEITARTPEAIILVDIPLLIESNLQGLFHKTLVVYTPEEQQRGRLVKRDGISRDEAAGRLKSQLPIDEKVGYADFVIRNEGSLDETRKQVDDLWEKLVQLQKEKTTVPA
ncbi:MAG: dephospho-CoA kinase [Pseudomonadota bacterium]